MLYLACFFLLAFKCDMKGVAFLAVNSGGILSLFSVDGLVYNLYTYLNV